MTDTAIQTATLPQLEVEIKFYLQQTAQSIIEIGKRLIQAKEMLPHGEWTNWLKDNFALSQDTASNFMNVAKRFGSNSETSRNFNFSQLVTLLKLPAGEEEKFIEQKAAEGNAVEDMTIQELRAEIAQWKKQAEDAKTDSAAEIARLETVQSSLKATLEGARRNIDTLIIEKNTLEDQLRQAWNQKPKVITVEVEKEVVPADYQSTKDANAELKFELAKKQNELGGVIDNLNEELSTRKANLEAVTTKIQDLQSQLDKANKTVEKLKKTNERLERKQFELADKMPSDVCQLFQADIRDGLPQIADNSIDFIITDPPYPKEYLPLYIDLSKVAARVLKEGGSLVCMVGQSYLPEVINNLSQYLTYHWCMCYLTPGNTPQLWQKRTNTFWKPLLWFVKSEYKGDWIGNDVMESPANDKRFHEWGQSIGGMLDIVKRFTDPNQLILDPFVGGGTTGVTSVISGRKFIGIDINQDCLSTTEKRIKEAYSNVRK